MTELTVRRPTPADLDAVVDLGNAFERYVHPDLRGRGAGGMLVDLAEARARELGATSVQNTILPVDEAAAGVLGSRGYRPVRHFYRIDYSPRPFEQFRERMLEGFRYDPSLWTVVWAGDEIAGGTICEAGPYDMGWIRSLSVRRPWRRRGLGTALLLNAFAQFHARGERRVGLGVDAESPTGATRLYERAGMHVVEETAIYRKELE